MCKCFVLGPRDPNKICEVEFLPKELIVYEEEYLKSSDWKRETGRVDKLCFDKPGGRLFLAKARFSLARGKLLLPKLMMPRNLILLNSFYSLPLNLFFL